MNEIIMKFYESKYASCLKLLDEIKVRDIFVSILNRLIFTGQFVDRFVSRSARESVVFDDEEPRLDPSKTGLI